MSKRQTNVVTATMTPPPVLVVKLVAAGLAKNEDAPPRYLMTFDGNRIGGPDRPLMTLAMIIENILPLARYSSTDAADKDLAAFKKYVNEIELT